MLIGAMRDLGEASRRIRAARHLMREHALEDDPEYLRLVARLSEALDMTEAATGRLAAFATLPASGALLL